MMKRLVVLGLACLLTVVGLAGCDRDKRLFLSKVPILEGDMRAVGPAPMVDKVSFGEIDLAVLLDPDIGQPRTLFFFRKRARIRYEQQRLSEAFESFYEEESKKLKERRNRVQDRIMAASNQRCARYKQFLKRFDSYNNVFFGAITTGAAGLGAIFTPASTVAALSGAAAISSGIRSEVNDTLFQEKTIQVLTSGFEDQRKVIRKKITNYQACDIKTYSVETAIGDAIKYHDACSLITGLEVVAENVERAKDPGLKAMKTFMEDFNDLKKVVENKKGSGEAMHVPETPTKTTKPRRQCPFHEENDNAGEGGSNST